MPKVTMSNAEKKKEKEKKAFQDRVALRRSTPLPAWAQPRSNDVANSQPPSPVVVNDPQEVVECGLSDDDQDYEEARGRFRNIDPAPSPQGPSRPVVAMAGNAASPGPSSAAGYGGRPKLAVTPTTAQGQSSGPPVAGVNFNKIVKEVDRAEEVEFLNTPSRAQDNSAGTIVVEDGRKARKKAAQADLLRFLETKPFDSDRDELVTLGKAAGLVRDLSDAQKISFRKSLGFYLPKGNNGNDYALADDLRKKWKHSVSEKKKDADAAKNAIPEVKAKTNLINAKRRSSTPELYVFYMAGVFATDLCLDLYRQGLVLWAVLLNLPDINPEIYPGYWKSQLRHLAMRQTHFSVSVKNDSKIKAQMEKLGEGAVCLELASIACDDGATAQQFEAFIIHYYQEWHKKYPADNQPWIETTTPVKPMKQLKDRAEAFVNAGVKLFEFVPDDQADPQPYTHPVTLTELLAMDLPLKLRASAIKERWLAGTRVDEYGNEIKNDWGDRVD